MANFRQKLADAAASSGGGASKDVLLINMQNKKNQGRIQFIPFTPKGEEDSVFILNNVMEVAYQFEMKDKNDPNKKVKFNQWYRLLNREEFNDLNPEEEDHYKHLRSCGSKINSHKFSKNDKQNTEERKKRIRFKDYVLIAGWVIEHRNTDDKKINANVPAILAFSSKNFTEAFNKVLKARDSKVGGPEWQVKLFNDTYKRKMYLSIDYKLYEKESKKIGYDVSITIEKFDEETVRYTKGNDEIGYDFNLEPYKDKLAEIKFPLQKFTNVLGRLYNPKMIEGLTYRLHELMNKYCGGTYELKDNKKVDPVPVKDLMDGVKPDSKELPPTDEERSATSRDEWDD